MKPLVRLLRPYSLFGQLLFMMLLSAAVLQCVNFYAVFSIQKSYGKEFFSVGRDYISSMYKATRLMDEGQRAAFLEELSGTCESVDKHFHFRTLEGEPMWQSENTPKAAGVRNILRGMNARPDTPADVRVRILHEASPEASDPRYRDYPFPLLQVAARMNDGRWLELVQSLIMTDSRLIWRQRIFILIGSLLISIIMILMVRRATRPLRKLGQAAEMIGRNPEMAAPIEEEGSIEVREAAQSFNRMLRRICDSINERNGMLEAMGHDLRTPLARIQLRLGKIQPESLREKFAANIDEIQSIVEQGLELARSLRTSEKAVTLDVVAFLESLVDDMQAQGGEVSLDVVPGEGSAPLLVSARPTCLRRSIENLVINAIHYAGTVHISVGESGGEVAIDIDDDGPGIPDDLLEKVFEPYYRLEDSRNRGSGGTGLGLSIARNMLLLNGGSVTLTNRVSGGLRVHVTLPRCRPRTAVAG